MQLCYSAIFVETTPIAQTNVEFYETAYFFLKETRTFYKKNTSFYKKNSILHTYKKLKP